MKANAVAAVVFLLFGGVLAILVTLTRWQAVHLLPADWFYLVLTGHGLNMLVFWIIFFEIAVLYFAGSTLLGCRLPTPRLAWAGFALMLVGALMNNYAVFIRQDSSVMFTSYVPMQAHWSFYLGLILFAVGALIGCFIFLGALVVGKAERTYNGSIPLVTFGGADRVHHRDLHHRLRRDHPDPDVPVVDRPGRVHGLAPVPAHLVGVRPLVAADQRLGAGRGVVRGRGDRVRREADEREGEPHGVPALHPVHHDRERAPPARRPRPDVELEDPQHELRVLPRGARVDGARADRARLDRGRAARARASPRASSSGCARRRGRTRRSPGCSCRSSASASSAGSRA